MLAQSNKQLNVKMLRSLRQVTLTVHNKHKVVNKLKQLTVHNNKAEHQLKVVKRKQVTVTVHAASHLAALRSQDRQSVCSISLSTWQFTARTYTYVSARLVQAKLKRLTHRSADFKIQLKEAIQNEKFG